jgi:hypothetical protein
MMIRPELQGLNQDQGTKGLQAKKAKVNPSDQDQGAGSLFKRKKLKAYVLGQEAEVRVTRSTTLKAAVSNPSGLHRNTESLKKARNQEKVLLPVATRAAAVVRRVSRMKKQGKSKESINFLEGRVWKARTMKGAGVVGANRLLAGTQQPRNAEVKVLVQAVSGPEPT